MIANLARYCLMLRLVAAGGLKLEELARGVGPKAVHVVALVELSLAACLATAGAARRVSLYVCQGGYAGAAIVTSITIADASPQGACGCMGRVNLTLGAAAILQGLAIVCATLALPREHVAAPRL